MTRAVGREDEVGDGIPMASVCLSVRCAKMVGMSILVDLSELAGAVARHPTAYLLITGADRPHVGEVEIEVRDGVLVVPHPGRTARRVLPGQPLVTLLLPPHEPDGYSLVIDGSADLAGDELRVTPSHAVLHRRPRPDSPPSATGCEGDCRPLA